MRQQTVWALLKAVGEQAHIFALLPQGRREVRERHGLRWLESGNPWVEALVNGLAIDPGHWKQAGGGGSLDKLPLPANWRSAFLRRRGRGGGGEEADLIGWMTSL